MGKSFFKKLDGHALVKASLQGIFVKIHFLTYKLQADRARIHTMVKNAIRKRGQALDTRAATSVEATNIVTGYTMKIGIGKPTTMYDVIVDTRVSRNDKPYAKTIPLKKRRTTSYMALSVEYDSSSMFGIEYLDKVSLGHNLTIPNQSIGVATEASGFANDGLLGLGPYALTLGTLIPNVSEGIHTNLASRISSDVLGVSFQPTNNATAHIGLLTFGSPNSSHFVGEITYTNIPSCGSAARYWRFKQSVKYGMKLQFWIVKLDSLHVTSAEMDASVGLFKISNNKLGNLQPLIFDLNGTVFELVWPRALNGLIGGDSNSSYLIVSDLDEVSGAADRQFVLGYTFL
ncbi:hypothetical protein M422DRAFT_275972 [Sphaerobolus stellatus SS14]|uniref:Peptidase A1 domain-containing protein n=1 Tax=Sphaerobolus stellatus (strain SS14) TaxID=990650 RepID=A0A0C9U310_SPHS4|nr:hypothetical protein M422DRAFT_275972 [Sphaerobolus stellatus SS14]